MSKKDGTADDILLLVKEGRKTEENARKYWLRSINFVRMNNLYEPISAKDIRESEYNPYY